MKHRGYLILALLVLILIPASLRAQVHHEIKIILHPEAHRIDVEDRITLPEERVPSGGEIPFLLHEGLAPASSTSGVEIVRAEKPSKEMLGVDPEEIGMKLPMEEYRVVFPDGKREFVLKYQGIIDHPEEAGEEYARSFGETPGALSSEGVYLAGSTFWYPWFDGGRITFTVEVQSPKGWEVISQGERKSHQRDESGSAVRWESPEPQEEIFLVGGPLTEYRKAGPVEAMAFLRKPDPELAEKYLGVTGQYIEMYQKLIGPYPYKKFALVENYWETGYGMPSFTLLGAQVIRLPFILHSSYPHEILHNWWGNGVYVDFQSGNWSEGLTAYLADHLISEQRGKGAEARRASLQKYADYVAEGKDFPLTAFRGRHSAASEAVGYGKTLMLFHMLRRQLGDDLFVRALQKFYRDHRFKRAGFADLQRAFSAAAGKDLQSEFDQWVTRAGAPALRVGETTAKEEENGFLLTVTLEQIQAGPPYRLSVPIAVTLEGQERVHPITVDMDAKRQTFSLSLPARPLRFDIDPEFDLFRRLDRNEIPPALSFAFGAEKGLMILPSSESKELLEGYRQLAEAWGKTQSMEIEIKLDSELEALPSDRAVWILGWNNRFKMTMIGALADYHLEISGVQPKEGADVERSRLKVHNVTIPLQNHSLVFTTRHPANPARSLSWIATDRPDALPGLARKLPHYGPYSYLAFEGEEPTNVVKGQWPVIHSPMTLYPLNSRGERVEIDRATLPPRQALATLPAVFSDARMMEDIRFLSAETLRGRGFGTPELDQAAEYIVDRFRKAGLKPGGDSEGSYFQSWKERGGDPEQETTLKNVIGILPGSRPEWAGQSVVVGAHYDHLGEGWPDVHQGDKGKVHPGADDNASGVAILLELARVLAKEKPPERTVIFVAFSGEEAGRRGSKRFVAHSKNFPPEKMMGMVNLDTVGRLGQNKLLVFGTGSAEEWIHLFNGVGFVTGVPIQSAQKDLGTSDQVSFADAGVPAVQLNSGPNLDYHRPSDTADKIDQAGLIKVASVLKEAVAYLTTRPGPLTSLLPQRRAGEPPAPAPGRKVSLGTIPDFGDQGKGILLEGIIPGSPADQAGLQKGDRIVRIGAVPITNLRDFSEFLKTLHPGDRISILFLRDGKEQTAEATVKER
ncbi:MAG: M20/M25/M40 family metallo-hydrolase [Candidatus Manganitrophus sp.]|nr:M20/M25/M40 family metallo-hydrolase [Candidatus Manganitrophus sp.]WDT71309.1 MAG: M20/M25/M40 family metallo-hydrolase [Candidatus Manganitrophus sp.]